MEAVKDSAFINALLPLVVIIFIIGAGVVLLYQHFQKNLFSQKLEKETLKNQHQSDLLRSSIQVQEEERKRIAQDLHDELGAVLSIMRMNMVMLEQNKETPENLLPGLQNVRGLSETALTSIRSISHRLMPPQLESFGLEKTLESVIGQINTSGKIQVALAIHNDVSGIEWAVTLGVYRILMELINNTLKHAKAKNAYIDIRVQNKTLMCQYTDDGRGLPDNKAGNGLGHTSIDGRITALNGTFEMGNRKEGGFYASMQIPIISI